MKVTSIAEYKGPQMESFDCGQRELNDFLTKYARQNDKRGIGRTYLGIVDEALVGFFTLAAAEISCDELPSSMKKGLPRYPVPAIRIGRLGANKTKQGKGYGGKLLKEALIRSALISSIIGAHLVIVDAKPSAAPFYEHYGFIKLMDTDGAYVLPISVIQKAFGY